MWRSYSLTYYVQTSPPCWMKVPGNDYEFIIKKYYLRGLLRKPKAKSRELMLKMDNIIPLWRVVIPNMVSESCLKLGHVNRIIKYRTKNCESQRCSQKWLKCRTNGVLCSRALEKGVEPRLRGGYSRAPQASGEVYSVLCSREDYWEWVPRWLI